MTARGTGLGVPHGRFCHICAAGFDENGSRAGGIARFRDRIQAIPHPCDMLLRQAQAARQAPPLAWRNGPCSPPLPACRALFTTPFRLLPQLLCYLKSEVAFKRIAQGVHGSAGNVCRPAGQLTPGWERGWRVQAVSKSPKRSKTRDMAARCGRECPQTCDPKGRMTRNNSREAALTFPYAS